MRFHVFSLRRNARRSGYTLIEIMLATGLSLLLLASAVRIFLMMNEGFSQSRQLMEMMGRMRNTMDLLQKDLGHRTAQMQPPLPVTGDGGYFTCGTFPIDHAAWEASNLEGLVDMSVVSIDPNSGDLTKFKVDPYLCGKTKNAAAEADAAAMANSITGGGGFDSRDLFNNVNGFVGLTVCNFDQPFRYKDKDNNDRETPYGEVVWFVYKNSLYRAFMPVVPARDRSECATYFEGTANKTATDWGCVPYMPTASTDGLPSYRKVNLGMLGDPRYRILSMFSKYSSSPIQPELRYDEYMGASSAKNNPYVWGWLYRYYLVGGGSVGSAGESYRKQLLLDTWLILPNVIQFTVEVWDPKLKKYVTLGNNNSDYYTLSPAFQNAEIKSARKDLIYCYDTWSTLLSNMSPEAGEAKVLETKGNTKTGYFVGTTEIALTTNASPTRSISPPPYTAPLPGIRIRVRAFDPDTGQAKEFHVAQDFQSY